jgi:hypothetical protein
MAFNDIYRMRIYQSQITAQVVNVLHFVQDDPLPTRGGLELAQDFVTNMTTTLKARSSLATSYLFVEVQKIVPMEGGPVTVNFPAGTTGGVSGGLASATLAEVVTIYSQRGGRRGRGRIYLPSSSTDAANATDGQWTTTQSNRTVAFCTALAARYIDATKPIGWALGVWSRASGPVMPPWTTAQFARATALVVRRTIRNQRRRQLGVGR